MRTLRSTTPVLALVLATQLVADAGAASLWSSTCLGDADVKMTYNAGDQVCASGDVDIVPPGQICGAGDLYVIPRDHPNPFADVTLGDANFFTTCLGAGAFIDQSVWLPPLKPGQYELVLDQYPFNDPDGAGFDPATDVRGAYFTVSNAPIVFSCDPAAIKMAAADSARAAAWIERTVKLIEAIQFLQSILEAGTHGELAYAVFCEVLDNASEIPFLGCPKWPWDWTLGKALDLLSNLGEAIEHMYADIAADPPDANFLEVVPIQMTDPLLAKRPFAAPRDDEFSTRMATIAQLLAIETAAYRAFLPSFEKEQGAHQAQSHEGLLIQSEKMIAYLDLAKAAGEEILVEVDAIEAMVPGNPELARTYDLAVWKQRIDDAAASGLSESDKNFMRSFGATDDIIDQATEQLAELAAAELPPTLGYMPLLGHLRDQHTGMVAAVDALRAEAEAVRAENEPYAFRVAPQASIAAPPPGTVGVAMTLTASATHFDSQMPLAYAWDTDLDGEFDDGAAASVELTPAAPNQLVTVRVTGGARSDVAFARITAVATNAPPRIEGLSPANAAPFAAPQESVEFHVDASDADQDPLTITWLVDEVEAGSGADFTFVMPDDQAHRVTVVVADGNAYTPDAQASAVVRAGKWEDDIDDGPGGGDDDGGGCCDTGARSPGDFLGLLLLGALVWWRVRRPRG